MITLEATQRNGSPDAIRAQEMIPAVYYGAGKDAVSIAVPVKEFTKVFKEAGENTAVTLTIAGKKSALLSMTSNEILSLAHTHT